MKTKVIKDRCIGCCACNAIVPDVFTMEDDGLAGVIKEDKDNEFVEVKEEHKENVVIASESCPVSAIEVEE